METVNRPHQRHLLHWYLASLLCFHRYFGAWGSFINSVFLFATWLRENKNLEFIRMEEKEREERMEEIARH